MKDKNIKYFFFFLFFLLLWAPILQDNFKIFKGGELKGAYQLPDNIPFDFKLWFKGTYPEKKSEYLTSNFGFRPDFVRLQNQLKYWLFHTAVNDNVTIGKEDYLYENGYINAYFGTDYVGLKEIQEKTTQLKELQNALSKYGTFLFVVLAPGKGSFYPEYIPDYRVAPKRDTTIYSSYVSEFNKAGINYIDMKAWFTAMKDTSSYKLFPRCGVHWSQYGDFLAFDSIVHYVENKTGKDLPDIKLDSIQLDTKWRCRDYDAGEGLNLIFDISHKDTLAYPFFSVKWQQKDAMTFLTIGDSYYYEMFGKMSPYIFKEVNFWYYFTEFHSMSGITTDKNRLREFLPTQDVIMLMYTDGTLPNFGSDFIKEARQKFLDNN